MTRRMATFVLRYRLMNHDGPGKHKITKDLNEAAAWQKRGCIVQTRELCTMPYSGHKYWRGKWWEERKPLAGV